MPFGFYLTICRQGNYDTPNVGKRMDKQRAIVVVNVPNFKDRNNTNVIYSNDCGSHYAYGNGDGRDAMRKATTPHGLRLDTIKAR